jgi:DNA-binding transcriptional LysR family regulator
MNKTPVDYKLLAIFVAVAEEASFSMAARKLGLGKGTVSRAISTLEDLLGAELIHRNTRRVALSTAGTELYERTARHLVALDAAVCELPERSDQPSGQLRMTAPHDFGVIVLPHIISQFSKRYPDVRFDVHLGNARVDLVAEGFDLAIRASGARLEDSSLTARRLASAGIAFYAAPSYLARRGRPRHVGETGHDWVIHPRARAIWAIWKAPRDAAGRVACDDMFLIRELLREGVGVGVLPRFLAEPYVRDGLLEAVPLADSGLRDKSFFFLVYPSRGQVPRKVTAFRDFLLERLKKSTLD